MYGYSGYQRNVGGFHAPPRRAEADPYPVRGAAARAVTPPWSVRGMLARIDPTGGYERLYKELTGADMDQAHLFAGWTAATRAEDARRLMEQLDNVDKKYPGGLRGYVSTARRLLADAAAGVNPLDGYTPSVPLGERLDALSEEFLAMEARGMAEMDKAAFVLVAGGLGERLGYKGIKIALPVDTLTKKPYIQLYCEYLAAFGRNLPLAVMTSGDTHEATVALLERHSNFGLGRDQITLIKQELVPAMTDNAGHFCVRKDDAFALDMKPHGHGDVHTLLYQSGIAQKWAAAGRKWVVFFQDTNALVFRSIPPAIGVSATKNFEMNSLTVPRTAGEAAGGIARLTKADGSAMTCNVEYNQLGPLLKATVNKDGDVADPATGFSPFPGNLNVFVLALDPYVATLERTKGLVPEFVNPKYKKGTDNTVFESPTRLECMMQDYPKALAGSARVGFTQFDRWISFSAVKNNVTAAAAKSRANLPPECAASGEFDWYQCNMRILEKGGAKISGPAPATREFAGVAVTDGPKVHIAPAFAPTCQAAIDKVSGLVISARSALILEAPDATIRGLHLDGAARVSNAVTDATVSNRGVTLDADLPADAAQSLQIRGYDMTIHEMATL